MPDRNRGAANPNDFDNFSQPYQAWVAQQSAAAQARLVQSIIPLLSPDGRVLDAGCGDGSLAVALAPFARQVVGLDLSREMIDLARHNVAVTGATNVHLVIGNLEQLAINRRQFAVVVSSFALHHTPLRLTLPQLAQMVQPGGWLVLLEPTCPVIGLLRPLWYGRQGIRAIAQIARQQGGYAAWRSLRFQSRWLRHQLADNHPGEAQWRDLVTQSLPGAAVRPTKDGAAISVMWRRPEPVAATPSPAAPVVPASTPIQVGRRYPRPAPAAYVPFPREAIEGSVVARFEAQVAQHQSRPALRSARLNLTYGELNAAANQVARRLLAQTSRSEAPVAIVMDQDEPVIPAIFGVLKTGRPYVVIDPADSPERQARILDIVGAECALTTATGARAVTAARQLLWEELGSESTDNLGLAFGPDHLAAIFFTSGSTGEPKGVARDQRQLLHSTWLNTNSYYVAPTDRQSLLYFPGFTASVPNIYDTLLNGAMLCPLNPRNLLASDLLRWLREEQITHFNPPIGLWRGLLERMPPGETWPDLRLITLAGQRIYGKDIRDFQSRFGANTTLLYVLAMTEAGAVTQAYIDHATAASDGPAPVGYPVADKPVTILNEEGLPAAAGEAGRIAVSSRYLSLGYWQAGTRSVAAFEAAPDPASGLPAFITSDRGSLRPDGCLEHYGREDAVVKVRGYRVDLAAVETVLNSHPQVEQAVVLARPRPAGDATLTAYLVLQPHSHVSAQLLRAYADQSLSHFMVPERFVFLDAMPLTSSGKIDRQRLRPPSTARPDLATPFIAPRNELEEQIAAIWAELLELDAVGVEDNFFELGGDSILVLRMILAVEQRCGCTIPAHSVRQPTVAHLAQWLAGATVPVDASPLSPVETPVATAAAAAPLPAGPVQIAMRSAQRQQPRRPGYRRITWASIVRRTRRPVEDAVCRLPYGVGVARLRQWLASATRLGLYAPELALLNKMQSALGDARPPAPARRQDSLLGNVLMQQWQHLLRTSPDRLQLPLHSQEKGMHILRTAPQAFWRDLWRCMDDHSLEHGNDCFTFAGWERLAQAMQRGQGVILLSYHSPGSPFVLPVIRRRLGCEPILTVAQVDVKLQTHTLNPYWGQFTAAQLTDFTAEQTLLALQRLRQGEIVQVVNEQEVSATNSLPCVVGGREYKLKVGFAELAAITGAAILPMFSTWRSDGRIHTTLRPELQVTDCAAGQPGYTRSLLDQHAAFLEASWRSAPESMLWGTMRSHVTRPTIA